MLHWARLLHENLNEVHFFSFDAMPHTVPFAWHRLPRFFLPGYSQFLIGAFFLSSQFKRESIELLHSFYSTNYGLLATASRKIPAVVTCAGSDILVEPRRNRFFHYINQIVFSQAKGLNPVAEHLREKIVADYIVDSKKIFVFPEGIDLNLFRPNSQRAKSGSLNIVSTRNFYSIYNLEIFFQIIPEIAEKFKNVRFFFLGDGPLRNQYQEKIASLHLGKRVSFLGWQSRDKLAQVLRQSHIYISTSLSDGASTSLLEAMASGCFPVVSDIPANREWIRPERNGLLFSTDSPENLKAVLIQAIENAALREQGAQVNWRLIQVRADERIILKKLEELYSFALDRQWN